MKSILCRILIALMIWTPYQIAQAGMIGTEQFASTTSQADRANLINLLNRADVSRQLQMFGIDATAAKDRVNAMTDQEVSDLNSRIAALPAGGVSDGAVVLLVILIAAGVWWAMRR
ncbi:MAG: PA2779 family protein [Betaproteobacteria bacterium]